MTTDFGFSPAECKLIKKQIERRAKFRQEFLKKRSNPCNPECGYVFDEAIQRFLSMKATQLEFFQFTPKTIMFAVGTIVIPMTTYGYAIWTHRQKYLKEISCGQVKYKDRLFKFR